MANQIIGLDFGTYSVKLVRLERGRDPQVIGYDEEPLPRLVEPEQDFEAADTQVGEHSEVEGAPESDGQEDKFGPAEERGVDPDAELAEHDETVERWEIALDRLIERGAFDEEGLVVTFLPDGQAMSIHQQVPFPERAKVENILPHMLDDRLPVDPSQVTYDFQLIDSTVEEGAEAVVGFARKEHIGQFLGELRSHDIDPAVLGIPELLLTYGLERSAPTEAGTYAVVDIGHEYTRVLVLHEREPVIARSVQFGGHKLTEALSRRFDLSYEQAENLKENRAKLLTAQSAPTQEQRMISEALQDALRPFVRDLRRTFQSLYASSRIELDEIYVCGGTSLLDNLPNYLTEEFGVQVSPLPIDPVPGVSTSIADPADRMRMALATSTALQQIDGRDEERLIDLRKGEFTYRGKSSYLRSQMLKYGAAAAILFFLLIGMLFTQKIEMESQQEAMRTALQQQTTELFGQPIYSDDELRDRLIGGAGGEKGFVPEMSAYQLYYELASRISNDVELEIERFEVDVDRNVAQIYGETSAESVERLMDDLRKLDCLKDVRQEGELNFKSDDVVDFHLHVSSECS